MVDHKVKGVGFDLQALDHILYTYAAEHGLAHMFQELLKNISKNLVILRWKTSLSGSRVHTILLEITLWVSKTSAAILRRLKARDSGSVLSRFAGTWAMVRSFVQSHLSMRTRLTRMFLTVFINTAYINLYNDF